MRISFFLAILVSTTNIVWCVPSPVHVSRRAAPGKINANIGKVARPVPYPSGVASRTRAKAAAAAAAAAAAGCPTSGFAYSRTPGSFGCVCQFAGACNLKTNKPFQAVATDPNLANFAPKGMDVFSLNGNNVGRICEGDFVAILYDCNARAPLFAATMLTGLNAQGT
jgi:hypothetical protein